MPYRSVDGDTLLERFPIITAGVSYEGDVAVFFKWLSGAGIPLSPRERVADSFPIVGAGGALTYINPLILSAVCDFIVLGDALDVMPMITSSLRRFMSNGDRPALWESLAEIPSVLVPPIHLEGGARSARSVGRSLPLDAEYPMCSVWTTEKSAFGGTLLAELQRGCMRNCKYCTLPGCFGRARFRRFDILKDVLDAALDITGAEQVGLVTPEAGDYVDIEPLLDHLEERGVGVSFASLRVDRLTGKMLEAVARGGRHSVTIAPETARDELRFSCGKKFTNDLVLEKLSMAKDIGIDQVKLYFMVGLPGETDEDIAAIPELCSRIIEETGQNLILSVSPFVPKPGTPWASEKFSGSAAIRAKYEILGSGVRKIRKKAPQLRLTSPKEAESEFDIAWYGRKNSIELAKAVSKAKKTKINHSNRDKTLLELEHLWQG